MTNIKPGDLFTVTHKEGTRLYKIGDRSYITDIFYCESAEQVNPERFIVTGRKLEKKLGNILAFPKKDSLFGDYLNEFSSHEDNIYKYEGVYKLTEDFEEPTSNNN